MKEKVRRQLRAKERAEAAEEERIRQEAEKRAWLRELGQDPKIAVCACLDEGDENGIYH